MNTLPEDIKRFELLKHMTIHQILHLSQTNKYYNKLSKNNSLWIYLLKRDFGILDNYDNPKYEYLYLYQTLNIFNIFPIITLNALKILVTYFTKDDLIILKKLILKLYNKEDLVIFTIKTFNDIKSSYINDYYLQDDKDFYYYIEDVLDILNHIIITELDIFEENYFNFNCNEKLSSSYIFVYKKLTLINSNLDLLDYYDCETQLQNILEQFDL